ncbi:MAG: hypothetical protein QXS62_05945 [Sulfolobales archaeon]
MTSPVRPVGATGAVTVIVVGGATPGAVTVTVATGAVPLTDEEPDYYSKDQ